MTIWKAGGSQAVVLGALLLGGSLPNQAPPSLCGPEAGSRLRPSQDLYCLELVARPDVPATVRGVVELGRAESPFDVATSRDGSQRFNASLVLSGLPAPGAMGAYTSYVVWVTPPSLDPMIKLGVVTNGRTPLGEIGFDKFLVFVTAEASAEVTERAGRLVLRGMSPSIRMQQHSLLLVPRPRESNPAGHDMAAMDHGDLRWTMPPARPGTPMVPMPGVDELVPPVEPFLPGALVDASTLPEAKPRTLARLRNGDTLDLTASLVRRTVNGRSLVMYAYNGQYPGPLIQADQGTTVVVRFHNAIDLPTAVHWHGLRLENRSDGAPGVTQDPVRPGERFVYRLRFRDSGIYWYHPHVREDLQQDLGLYGNILVRPRRPDAFGPSHREETVMLDDILLGEAGLIPYGKNAVTHALMGRFGNTLLVNGDPTYRLEVRPNEIVRFYFTNVANTRTFNLSIPGAQMKLAGADVGRYEREEWTDHVVIAPAQRYIVDVRFPAVGRYPLLNRIQSIDHNLGNFYPEEDTLGVVTAAGPSILPDLTRAYQRLRTNGDVVTDIGRYRPWFSRPADKELLLTLKLGELPFGVMQMLRRDVMYSHPVEWSGTMPMMDWLPTGREAEWVLRDPATGKENMAIDWRFRVGDVVKIRIANDRTSLHPMSHPIHLHGQRFLVLAHNDVPNQNLVWKDTVLIPVGGTADLLVEMSNPGKWMMHCHIAEHLESGMMGVFEVR